jgi:hypothetical protein
MDSSGLHCLYTGDQAHRRYTIGGRSPPRQPARTVRNKIADPQKRIDLL